MCLHFAILCLYLAVLTFFQLAVLVLYTHLLSKWISSLRTNTIIYLLQIVGKSLNCENKTLHLHFFYPIADKKHPYILDQNPFLFFLNCHENIVTKQLLELVKHERQSFFQTCVHVHLHVYVSLFSCAQIQIQSLEWNNMHVDFKDPDGRVHLLSSNIGQIDLEDFQSSLHICQSFIISQIYLSSWLN